jgi:polyisoprenoid-binding protein YceI
MSRKLVVPIVAVVALLALGGGAAYAYFFSGLRTTPPALALASPSPVSSTSTSPPGSTPGTTTWTVRPGSLAGYRVKEQFVGQSSSHEAVARTSSVSGQVTITQSGSTYELTSATITVGLSGLASVDSIAGYNVTNRDRTVRQALDASTYPSAVFVADGGVTLPAEAASGQAVSVSVPGKLTIHGVTKEVTATVQLRVSGSTAQVAGSIATNMTDFGVNPPTIGFTTVQPAVTIEVSLKLSR